MDGRHLTDAMAVFDLVAGGDADGLRGTLARQPALAEARDAEGVSVVLRARYQGRDDLVAVILAAGPTLDVFDAAALGRTGELEQLLGLDPSLAQAWSGDGFTPLHLAAFFDQVEAARLLLAHGADPGAVSRNPMAVQPLHSAAAGGRAEVVRLLLEAGADPNARQHGGWTPLHAAARRGDAHMVDLLVTHGADPRATDDAGESPAGLAADTRHEEAARPASSTAPRSGNPPAEQF